MSFKTEEAAVFELLDNTEAWLNKVRKLFSECKEQGREPAHLELDLANDYLSFAENDCGEMQRWCMKNMLASFFQSVQ